MYVQHMYICLHVAMLAKPIATNTTWLCIIIVLAYHTVCVCVHPNQLAV